MLEVVNIVSITIACVCMEISDQWYGHHVVSENMLPDVPDRECSPRRMCSGPCPVQRADLADDIPVAGIAGTSRGFQTMRCARRRHDDQLRLRELARATDTSRLRHRSKLPQR
jgi:hypothetical protein